jgi:hypothetical protein
VSKEAAGEMKDSSSAVDLASTDETIPEEHYVKTGSSEGRRNDLVALDKRALPERCPMKEKQVSDPAGGIRAGMNYFADGRKKDGLIFSYSGSLNGKRVRILMDSGAENNFIAEKCVRAGGMKTTRAPQPMKVRVADGTESSSDRIVNAKLVIFQEDAPRFIDKVQLHVANLDNNYDVLLGQPWLEAHEAGLCFKTKGVWLQKSGRVLHANGHTSLMPYKEMVQAWLEATEQDLLGVVTVPQQASVNQICSGEHESPGIEKFMQRMKEKYGAIMVDELPPQHERKAEHDVVHHIQLVPGAEPIAEPLRRMSPKLLEELKPM